MVKCRVMGGANRRWSSRGCASFDQPAARRAPPFPDDEQLEQEEEEPWCRREQRRGGEESDDPPSASSSAAARALSAPQHLYFPPLTFQCAAYYNSSTCRLLLFVNFLQRQKTAYRSTNVPVGCVSCSTVV